MKSIIALALVLLFAGQTSGQLCYNIGSNYFYNIYPWSHNHNVYTINATNHSTTNQEPFNLNISFCQAQVQVPSNTNNYFAALELGNGDETYLFSQVPSVSVWNPSSPNSGVTLLWTGFSQDNQTSGTLNVTFICTPGQGYTNSSYFGNATSNQSTNGVNYYFGVTVQSEYGCGTSTLQIIQFIQDNQALFSIVFIILGAFVCFYGYKAFDITLFIIAATSGLMLSGTFVMEFFTYNSQTSEKWVLFGVCCLIGLVCGYLAVKFEKVGFFALGACLGVVAGSVLYFTILAPIFSNSNGSSTPQIVFYVTLVLLGIIGGLLGIWIYKAIIVISTSLVGSFMAIDSVAGFTGFSVVDIAYGTQQFSGLAYVWLVLMGIMAIAGMYVQFKHQKEKEDEDAEANPNTIYNNLGGDF